MPVRQASALSSYSYAKASNNAHAKHIFCEAVTTFANLHFGQMNIGTAEQSGFCKSLGPSPLNNGLSRGTRVVSDSLSLINIPVGSPQNPDCYDCSLSIDDDCRLNGSTAPLGSTHNQRMSATSTILSFGGNTSTAIRSDQK